LRRIFAFADRIVQLKAKKPTPARPADSAPAASPIALRKPPAGHKFWFRLTAIAVPLLGLVLLEILLRLAGYGYPTMFFLKSRTNGVPVFIENEKFSRRYFPPGLERTPQPVVIPKVKPPNTIRLFIFGESAAMGDPEPAFGFGRILEVMLQEAFTNKRVEVINVAVTAINSHVIREIAKDCADKQGDYWLVYMGNNEVVGPFGAGTIFGAQAPSLSVLRANLALKNLRLGQLLDALRQKLSGSRGTPKTWAGMEMFLKQKVVQHDPRMTRVYKHFETNLRDIVRLGRNSGVRVLVSPVVCNLKDCPPFASQHRRELSEAQRTEWDRLFQAGVKAEEAGNLSTALASYQKASEIDGSHAELRFRMGRCEEALGELVAARESFSRARDLDALRFRADSRVNAIISNVAAHDSSVGKAAADATIERHSTNRLVGDQLFYEHVHLNFSGNYLLARAFAEQILSTATNTAVLLSEVECAHRLAFTDFDRYRVLDEVRQRLALPPFNTQLGHEQRERRIREQLDRLQSGSFTAARTLYEQAIARRPDDPVLRENFAALLQDFSQAEAAEIQWRRMAELLPHSVQACYGLANSLDTQGKSTEAVRWFAETLRRSPDSIEAHNGLGLALANLNRSQEAIREFERALRLKPDFVEARINLGQTLTARGRLDDAMAQYAEALRVNSNSVPAHINLGKLLSSQNRPAQAAAHYREAIRIKPDNAIAHFNLGNALTALNHPDAAAQSFAEAVRLRPGFAEAQLQLGHALARQGNNAGALAQFEEVVRLKPNWPEALFNYGVALAKSGRFTEAAEQFQETLRSQPDNVQAKKFLDQAVRAK
jgi:tetratricopeptide (TPR) repeat protein